PTSLSSAFSCSLLSLSPPPPSSRSVFSLTAPASPPIYPLSLHDALPISFQLSHMEHRPDFPTPMGVFRARGDVPRYEDVMNQQIKDVIAKRGRGDLAKLLRAGDTWEVK